MAIISNNTPSTEGHAPPPPNVLGAQKPGKSSSYETKTDKSTESTIFHLEAAWGTETIDASLKVGAAGIAFILALALLALAALTEAVTFTTSMTLLDLVDGTIWVLLSVMLSVVVLLMLSVVLSNTRQSPTRGVAIKAARGALTRVRSISGHHQLRGLDIYTLY
ncbi:hypothetical protein FAGAP_11994 [Fusarium agapanthi]|uniref:Uncharacterized protein n=1 Tax=Fusarium agapanthi TaxID=1803897 RepID=A0A9P5AZW9_9HYPO|nr:hypothetical protein FAGAP_11994 [Fusarium agapanthi]